MRWLLPALLFLIPGVLGAQAASHTYIDQKAPYKNPNPPILTALNLPKIGTAFKVQVGSFIPGNCVLAFGVSNPNISVPSLRGFLFTSAEIIVPAWGSVSFPIPNSTAWLGVKFYQQAHCVECGIISCSAVPLSRGGVGVIGR